MTIPWSDRIGKTWLLVNERSDALAATATEPRLSISEPEGLAGILAVNIYDGGFSVVDPSHGDFLAEMMLVMPQAGRDINDLFVVAQDGEEWMRYGSYFYRPLETVPALPDPGGTVVIGADGYAEWRAISSGGADKTVTVTSSGTWRLFDPALTWITTKEGSDTVLLTSTPGNYYLIFYGQAGDIITVVVN